MTAPQSAIDEPLHVLMPTDVFPPVAGGAGWSAHALARALQERGHAVTAIVPRAVRLPLTPTIHDAARAPTPPHDVLGVPVVEVPYPVPALPFVANWYRHEMLWPLLRNVIVHTALRWEQGTGNREQEKARRHQVTALPHPNPRIPNPASMVRRRTLIHAQHVQSVPAAVLAGQELGVPVVATIRDHWPWDYFATGLHGDRVPYPTNRAASLLTDLVARLGPVRGILAGAAIPYMLGHLRRRQTYLAQTDAVIAVSQYIAGRMPATIPREHIHSIPNIVDVDAIQRVVATPASVQRPAPFVLFVGKLEHNKGAHLLPEVMATARDLLGGQVPELVIAGNGALADTIQHAFGALGLPLHLLPGWTDHDDVLRLMHQAEVLLFPSAWGEPLSRVPLEASAAGACIAAIPTGGTAEIIEHGFNGVLAPDAYALGRSLATLLRDDPLRTRLRVHALQRARERWSPAVVASRVEALYRGFGL